MTLSPCPWSCRVGWCLADVIEFEIRTALCVKWLGKDFTFLMYLFSSIALSIMVLQFSQTAAFLEADESPIFSLPLASSGQHNQVWAVGLPAGCLQLQGDNI